MKKQLIQISASKLKKVHSILKKHEKNNTPLKVGQIKLSNFLASSVELNSNNTIEIHTKQIILQIAGEYTVIPEQLNDNVNLKDNLNYSDDEYAFLQSQLNNLIKGYKKEVSISSSEINKCKTVSDCIKLVESKIKQPQL